MSGQSTRHNFGYRSPCGKSTVNSVDCGDEHRAQVPIKVSCGCVACRHNIGSAGAAGNSAESTHKTAVNRESATIPAGRKRYPAPVRADRSGQLVTRSSWY